jgi:hypothetical protein
MANRHAWSFLSSVAGRFRERGPDQAQLSQVSGLEAFAAPRKEAGVAVAAEL